MLSRQAPWFYGLYTICHGHAGRDCCLAQVGAWSSTAFLSLYDWLNQIMKPTNSLIILVLVWLIIARC
jgi:hypothetical protein